MQTYGLPRIDAVRYQQTMVVNVGHLENLKFNVSDSNIGRYNNKIIDVPEEI